MPEPLHLEIRYPEELARLRVREGGAERDIELEGKAYERVEAAAALLLAPARLALRQGEPVLSLAASPDRRALRLGLERGLVEVEGEGLAGAPERAWPALWAVALREAGFPGAEREASALMSERAFWASRWRAGDVGWDLGQVAPPLLRAIGALPPGRAVVVGCGGGHEVRALAARGLEVVGVDFTAEAIAGAEQATARAGLRARFAQLDLFDLPASLGPFDYWVEHTCFCAIDPTRRAEYVEAAWRTLRPGGLLVGLFYAHGRPSGPPFTTSEAEVRERFSTRFAVEALALAPDSHERRAGEELLGLLRRL